MEFRDTAPLPTKSGVVGLLANALGRRRTDPIDDLARLRMGVAVLRWGRLLVDLHAVLDVATVGGGTKNKLTRRRYLMDASFLVGLEGEGETLVRLQEALANPARPLYLGRRGCLPSPPPYLPDGLVPLPLEEALGKKLGEMRFSRPVPLFLEGREGGEAVLDVPVDFDSRALAPRWVRRGVWYPEGGAA
jgi:CRISPR system Cascade subunit CasD